VLLALCSVCLVVLPRWQSDGERKTDEPPLHRRKADAGRPCSSPLACFQLLREAESQTHGAAEGQDCWGNLWQGTALAPSCLVSRAAGHQPQGDSDPHGEHLSEEEMPISAEGAPEKNASAHSLSLPEKQKEQE